MKQNKNGYSLIELLVVMVICVFIVFLAVLAVSGYIAKSEKTVCESERGVILRSYSALKLNRYTNQNKIYNEQDVFKEVIELSYQIEPIKMTYPYQFEGICQKGGIYTAHLDKDDNLIIECSEH